jgi:tripartite-type tricarboxylate transporter receptor subunit TctC
MRTLETASGAVHAVLKMPEVRERISKLGGSVVGGTPEHLGDFLKAEVARWLKVIAANFRRESAAVTFSPRPNDADVPFP